MVRNEHDRRPTCLRRETERALEEALTTGLDPRKEYNRLVWELHWRLSRYIRVSKPDHGLRMPR